MILNVEMKIFNCKASDMDHNSALPELPALTSERMGIEWYR